MMNSNLSRGRLLPLLRTALLTLVLLAFAAPIQPARADSFGFGTRSNAVAKKKRRKRKKSNAAKKAALKKAAAEKAAAEKAAAEKAAAEKAAAEKAAAEKAAAEKAAAEKTPVSSTAPVSAPAVGTPAVNTSAMAVPPGSAPLVYAPVLKPLWGGFFLSLNLGYATDGGKAGPVIPSPKRADSPYPIKANGNTFPEWAQIGCLVGGDLCYDKAIRTDVGAGFAADIQIGYNIFGYASLWMDLSWHGSFGSKVDTGGAGTAAVMLGLHPLRFVRADLPVDLKLYGGFGFFEILYYYEAQLDAQRKAKGKSWTGTSIPFGLSFEARIPESIFAIGLDLRMVRASYDKWIYNWDDAIESNLDDPITTLRFEPRLTFGWHF